MVAMISPPPTPDLSVQDQRLAALLMRDALNPEAEPRRLEALGRSDFPSVRYAVAGNARTPGTALDRLAHDADLDVRIAVARNPSTPEASLIKLAHDKSYALRGLLASVCDRPLEVFRILARDPQVGIRADVARNVSAPPEILEEMAVAALDGQWPLADSQPDERRNLLWVIASHPAAPEGTLARLGRCSFAEVREAVAGNRAAPAEIIEELREDLDPSVREAAEAAAAPSLMSRLGGWLGSRRR